MVTEHHRRSIRLPGYDYGLPSPYFITVCAYQHLSIFGEVLTGEMRLSAYGQALTTLWHRITEESDRVRLEAFTVMPNHLHAVILIRNDAETGCRDDPIRPVHREVRAASRAQRHGDTMDLGRLVTCRSGSLGAIVGNLKSVVTRRVNDMRHTPGGNVWQRNYYERIVRDIDELAYIRAYISANPARWAEDRFCAWD